MSKYILEAVMINGRGELRNSNPNKRTQINPIPSV